MALNSRNRWMAFKTEVTPGTAITTTAGIIYIPIKPGSGFDVKIPRIEPDETRGVRAETTVSIAGVKMYEGKIDSSWYSDDSPVVARMAFGKDTVTQPAVGSDPTVYDHTMIGENVTPLTTTCWDNVWNTSGQTYRYPWCAVNKWGIKFDTEKGTLEWNADLWAISQGLQSGTPPTPAYSAMDPFAGWKAQVTKGGVAFTDLVNFNFDITNNIKPYYGSNNSQDPNRLVYGKFGAKGKCVILATQAQYNIFLADTSEAVVIKFEGPIISNAYKHTFQLTVPQTRYQAKLDSSKEEIMIDLDLSGIYDPGISSPVQLLVRNNKAGTYY